MWRCRHIVLSHSYSTSTLCWNVFAKRKYTSRQHEAGGAQESWLTIIKNSKSTDKPCTEIVLTQSCPGNILTKGQTGYGEFYRTPTQNNIKHQSLNNLNRWQNIAPTSDVTYKLVWTQETSHLLLVAMWIE